MSDPRKEAAETSVLMQAGAEIISLRSELAEARAALAAANARIGDDDKVALWMMGHGYATGHGDTIQDMLDELEIQAKVRAEEGRSRLQAERDEYRNALRGLYGLVKLLYVGADDVAEIKRHLATNHRSLEAARVLGVTPIGDGNV